MCGIWAFISKQNISQEFKVKLYDAFMKIKNRGPEFSTFQEITNSDSGEIYLGFHRLAIMDTSQKGHQPFISYNPDGSCVYAVCNGEIYNYKELIKKYNLTVHSNSDCEVIIHMYNLIGPNKMIREFETDNEFAFIIIHIGPDKTLSRIYIGRDPIGVRPLFYARTNDSMALSSEAKGLTTICGSVKVFPPGILMEYTPEKTTVDTYYNYIYTQPKNTHLFHVFSEIRSRFTNAVRKRLMTDRPFGCLLSGGLDSSMVCGVAKSILGTKFPVYTISFPGGTDLPYAKEVAQYLDLDHHIISITPEEALDALDKVIYVVESFDITTIRASTMQYLAAKHIKNEKVILCGELMDELAGGYLYFHNAPSDAEFHDNCVWRVKDVHMFDGLRTDRTMAHFGIEIRLPYADREFLDYYLSLPAAIRRPPVLLGNLEKWLFREAFANTNTIPDSVRRRVKNAFSDSVSSMEKSWYQMIQEYIDKKVSDEEFTANKDKYAHCPPHTKEAYYYRKKFCEYFGDHNAGLIPYFWLPSWSPETKDPSARTLKNYRE
jgi:asparagine synthase (glutamine-hydrolysing)